MEAELRGVGLGTNAATELRLNHMEHGFDVRGTMILAKKVLFEIEVVVQHLVPRNGVGAALDSALPRVRLKRDERGRAYLVNGLEIGVRKVPLVGGNAVSDP